MSPIVRILSLFVIMGVAMLYRSINEFFSSSLPPPKLPLDQWWGDGDKPENWAAYVANTSDMHNNRIMYPDVTKENLRKRLNVSLKLVPPLESTGSEYGFNVNSLQKIIDYWRDDYLKYWSGREVFLWQFNQFTTEIQGLRMHFIYAKLYDDQRLGRQTYPVLLLHGWPGSVREFYKIIHQLHDEEKDKNTTHLFDIVAPSLPGFGWSQGTSKPGLGPAQMAVILRNLMHRLGFEKYFVQGGDWGGLIGSHMATLFPDEVLGYHSNMCTNLSPRSFLKGVVASWWPSLFAPRDFQDFFFPQTEKFAFLMREMGYFHLQATKPDTIGAALTDNPIGLAVYILEKFATWTNPNYLHLEDGGLTKHYELNALLDNIMIYYLTNSITTSQRIYAEAYSKSQLDLKLDQVPTKVPTGCARFKYDLLHFLDYQLRDKYPNLIHSTYYKEGGHFAALEKPDVLYKDFIEFVEKVEKFYKLK